jgi:cyclopropane fatty-acyl-phospholipid synthase-like methyltransferase
MQSHNTFTKAFSPACELNKKPILEVLREALKDSKQVLEIASGTGQHAVHFGAQLPHLIWQTSDLLENHETIQAWLDEANLPNVLKPLQLDVDDSIWPTLKVDAIFNANTVHIISWSQVEKLFTHISRAVLPGAVVCLYGPFNYDGKFTSDSNARFDASLRARDSSSGIRDFQAVNALAASFGLALQKDIAMPSNNRLLMWKSNE